MGKFRGVFRILILWVHHCALYVCFIFHYFRCAYHVKMSWRLSELRLTHIKFATCLVLLYILCFTISSTYGSGKINILLFFEMICIIIHFLFFRQL